MIDCIRPPRWVVFFSSPVLVIAFGILVASVALALAWIIHDAARLKQGKPYFGQPAGALTMLAASSAVLAFILFYLFNPNFLESHVRENTFGCGAMSPEVAWVSVGLGAGFVAAWAAVTRGWYKTRSGAGTRPNSVTAANVMNNATRRRIKSLVAANPGIHFSRIKGQLGMSPRTIRDQLHILEKFGHVTAMDVDGKRSYVVPGSMPAAASSERSAIPVLAFMQRGGREAVVGALLSSPGTRFTRLCDAVGGPRSNVRRKVEAMEARGYVIVDRAGREMVSIRFAPGVEGIVRLLHDASSRVDLATASAD